MDHLFRSVTFLHHLLPRQLGLLAVLQLTLVLNVVSSLLCEVLPDNLEGGIRIVRGHGWSRFSSLENDLDEFSLVLSVTVIREPVVEILAADSPTMRNSLRTEEADAFDIGDEYGF